MSRRHSPPFPCLAPCGELTSDLLDAVVGGFSAPPGGSVRSTTSDYRWMGMTYQQTTHEALDAQGNVTSTQVDRPGSLLWSERYTNDASGSRTDYSTGGNFGDAGRGGSVNGSFSTLRDANGNFTGAEVNAGAEYHSSGSGADVSLNVGGHGTASWADGFQANAQGLTQLSVTDPATGIGLRTAATGNAGVELSANESGVRGGYALEGNVDVALTRGGHDVIGGDVIGGRTSGHFDSDVGGFRGSIEGSTTATGLQVSGQGYLSYNDGFGNMGGSASIGGQTNGAFNVQGSGTARVDATFGPDGGTYTGRLEGDAAAHSPTGSVTANGSAGVGASFDPQGNFIGTTADANGTVGASSPIAGETSIAGSAQAEFDPGFNLTSGSAGVTTSQSGVQQEPSFAGQQEAPTFDYPSGDFSFA